MKVPEIISRKRIFDDFFAIDELKLENADGNEAFTRYIMVPKEAVAIILFRKDTNKVVFSKQYRLAAEEWLLEIPAGVMDAKSESPEATACRESLEETGYFVQSPEFICAFYPSPGNSSEKINLYFAEVQETDKKNEGGGLANEHEEIKVVELDLDESLRMLENGRISDGKTVMALLWLYRKFKLY